MPLNGCIDSCTMDLQVNPLTSSGAIGLQAFNEDLLHLIFLRALPSIFSLSSSPDDIFSVAPLNFSLVCRSWRQIALSHPGLWSSFVVIDEKNLRINHICRILKKWLALSSPTSLGISLEFRRRGLHALPVEILDIISPESSRCVDFHVFTHMDCVLPPSRFTYNCAPTLASLILQLWNRDPIDIQIDFTLCVRGVASNLRVLNLHASVMMTFPSQEEALDLLKLRELTHTIVTPSQFDDVLCVLFASANIEKIDLTIYGVFRPNPMVNPRRIFLPCLTSLTLLSNNRPIIMRFLTLLACPSLRSFDFGMPKMDGGGFLEPSFILDFISRPNPPPPLRSLSLTGQEPFVGAAQDSGHDTLRNLFALLGGLEKLDLRAPFVDSEIIRLLVVPSQEAQESGQHPLLPSLKEINMAWYGTSELIEQLAEEMLVSRYTAVGGTNLEEVVLSFPGFFRLQESERVKACVDRGLILNYL